MRAVLASLVQAIWGPCPLAFWCSVDVETLSVLYADSPRKRKPQRQACLTEFQTELVVIGG